MTPFDPLAFTKMEALGNDFVILDGRENPISLKVPHIQRIANRRLGIGCDQLLLLETSAKADIKISIFNADGSRAEMCGNGMRAVALYLDLPREASFETDAGIVTAEVLASYQIRVGMGEIKETKAIHIPNLQLDMGFSINLGNPHVVFFVGDLDALNIAHLGPRIENDPQFPHKTNVEFAKVISENRIEVRIWERGVGKTLACGSGACAVALAYWHHFGVKSDSVEVIMRGGALKISRSGSEIYQEGPARFVFKGILTPEFFHDE